MNETDRPARSAKITELAGVLARCNQQLQRAAPAGISPLLRVESGAGLIQGARAQHVSSLLEPVLALVAPCLFVPSAHSATARLTIRPKLRVRLRLGGAGLLAELRYFGVPPDDADLRALFAAGSASASKPASFGHALAASDNDGIVFASQTPPPNLPATVLALATTSAPLARGEVCVRAVWHEPPRRWPVVRAVAGRREVAVPMFSVEQALSEDAYSGELPLIRSLAMCLGEESSPSSLGRPALLILRRRGPALALRVEALLGHGAEVVHPVGPLLQLAPWVLGVIGGDEAGPPILVVDPLALPGLLAGPTP